MLDYDRPLIPDLVFRDERGAVIPYGDRWGGGQPPDGLYSVTLHPERFAPLVTVARAIVDHLVETYDIVREDSVHESSELIFLRPRDPDAAPLTFMISPFPSVSLVAGARAGFAAVCGCDACDESVPDLVEELEDAVGAVVSGGLAEWLNDGESVDGGLFLAHALQRPDGSDWQSGSSSVGDDERQRLRTEFAHVPPRWAPWSVRPGGAPSP